MGVLEGLKRLVKGDKSKKTLFNEGKGKKKNAAKPKPVMARLPTKYFTGSHKAVSAAETYGTLQAVLQIREASLLGAYFLLAFQEPHENGETSTLGHDTHGTNYLARVGTAGLVKLTVDEAELDNAKKGKEYFAVVSVGSQVRLLSSVSPQSRAATAPAACGGTS